MHVRVERERANARLCDLRLRRRYVREPKLVDMKQREIRSLLTQAAETRRQQEKAARVNEAMGASAVKKGGQGAEVFAAEAQVRAVAERAVETTQKVVEHLAAGFREGELAIAGAPKEAQRLRDTLISTLRLVKRPPSLITWANSLCTSLARILSSDKDKPHQLLAKLLADDGTGRAYICHLGQDDVDRIIGSLQSIHDRGLEHIKRINQARAAPTRPRITRPAQVVPL
jgi:hypothetical protein